MDARPVNSALADQAKAIDAVLEQLEGALDAARDPNRMALRSLGVKGSGWTPEVYSEEAFRIWADLHEKDPHDPRTRHHLAIMHHARAIDRERSDDPPSANEDWEASLRLWHGLWQSDAYWEALADRVCGGGKRTPVEDLRRDFPSMLLRLHYDIATDEGSSRSRVNYHVRTALESPFDEEAKEAARTGAYERVALQIPDSLWQALSPDPAESRKALDIIQDFVERDPGCRAALADALSILVRLLRSTATDLAAMGHEDGSRRKELLQEMRRVGEDWSLYLEQLVEEAGTLEDDVRHNLCLWHRVMGDIVDSLDLEQEAIANYRAGATVGSQEDSEGASCQRKMVTLEARIARNRASNGDSQALATCEALRGRDDFTPLAHMLLAHGFMLLEKLDAAEDVCRAGLSIEPDLDNFDFMEEDERALETLQDLLDTVRGKRVFDKGTEMFRAGEFEKAIPVLDEAVRIRPSEELYYLVRAQCHLSLLDLERAREDLEHFADLVGESEEPRIAAENLRVEIERLEGELLACGREALLLERKANQAAGNDDHESAELYLREALDVTFPEGRRSLAEKLSIILTGQAVDEANSVLGAADHGIKLELDARVARLEACRERLGEACELDPANQHAKSNLEALQTSLDGFEVNELRAQAAQAFSRNNYDLAISHQRRALAKSRGELKKQVKKDLAKILLAKAVKLANDAQSLQEDPLAGLSSFGSLMDRRVGGLNLDFLQRPEAMLREAMELLSEASRLDPTNDQVKTNIRILSNILRKMGL